MSQTTSNSGSLVTPPPASSIAGTIQMYADETATIVYNYIVPAGGVLPPAAASFVADSSLTATITSTGPIATNTINTEFADTVTIAGGGVASSGYVHAVEAGVDTSDILVMLEARPSATGTFSISSVNITSTVVTSTGS